MWPWLRSEHFKDFFVLTDRQKFFCKLCFLAFIGHVLILLLLTCSYFGAQSHERFVISAQHGKTVYVLSPLQKQIKLPVKQSNGSSISSSKVLSYNTYQQLKKGSKQILKNEPNNKQKIVEPVSDKKIQHSVSRLQPAVKNIDKALAPKKAQITINEVKIVKKTEPLKKSVLKKAVVEKKEVPVVIKKNNITKVENPSAKIPTPLPVKEEKKDFQQELQAKEVAKPESVMDNAKQDLLPQDDIAIDEVTFIGYEQLDSLAVQNKIQQVVEQNFKSPIGIKKGVSCELSVLIGDCGTSKVITVVRSSGILAYDMSARAMLYTIEFPKEVWNKTITIVLGQ